MKNEILREVWHNRDEFARRHNYDLDVMVKTLRQMEGDPCNPLVDRAKKRPANHVCAPRRHRRP